MKKLLFLALALTAVPAQAKNATTPDDDLQYRIASLNDGVRYSQNRISRNKKRLNQV